MKKTFAMVAAGLLSAAAAPAAAQVGSLQPQAGRAVAPVVPPRIEISRIGPNAYAVKEMPGVAAAIPVRVQAFSDYDRNADGVYNPMEFAQAMYFLSSGYPAAGNRSLPWMDRTMHRGAPIQMNPDVAVALLNITSDEFGAVDRNNDWRVSSGELAAASLM